MRVLVFALLLAILLASSAIGATEDGDPRSTATKAEQDLDILSARETGSSGLSRAHGHSDFAKIAFAAAPLPRNTENVNLLAAAGQHTFEPPLSAEAFGLGGPEFLHAFDRSEQIGDHGRAGRFEPQCLVDVGEPFLEAAPIYRFGDVGRIWNRDAAPGDVERMTSASASTSGVRFNLTEWLSGVVEVAVPLTGEVAPEELAEDGSSDEFRVFGSLVTTF